MQVKVISRAWALVVFFGIVAVVQIPHTVLAQNCVNGECK
jgi:hypothetical protein